VAGRIDIPAWVPLQPAILSNRWSSDPDASADGVDGGSAVVAAADD